MAYYYLLSSPKFWLCVLAGGALLVFIKRRLNFSWRQRPVTEDAPQKTSKAELRRLEKEARAENAEAQIKLADILYSGNGTTRNQTKAVEWYIKAAGHGNADACLKLGDALSKGAYAKDIVFDDLPEVGSENDIAKNEGDALRWYIKAAQKGLPRAQRRLTEMEARLQDSFLTPCTDEAAKVAEIPCGEGPDSYRILLTAKNLHVFQEASEVPEIRRKKGEDFAATLIKRGGIVRVERRRGSWLEDGPRSAPALQVFDEKGAPVCIMHYKDNRLHDSSDGAAAFQVFNAAGQPLRISHFKNGQRHDGAKGEAAFLLFSDNGSLLWAVHYKDDQVIKALNEHEIATYFETAKITQGIEKALPGVKIH